MINGQDQLSVRPQCRLLGLDRSGLYYAPVARDAWEIALRHRLYELYTLDLCTEGERVKGSRVGYQFVSAKRPGSRAPLPVR